MANNILVVNCGSSTLKFQLIDMLTNEVLAKGKCDKIKLPNSVFEYKCERKGVKFEREASFPTHSEAISTVLAELVNNQTGPIASVNEIAAVGHRAVHGGETFNSSVRITDEVIAKLNELAPLAPLHNPACVIGMQACMQLLPNVPHVAVFDTAFHQTMPEYAYTYAIPHSLYETDKIRRYGFHGTSYAYVSKRMAEILGKNVSELNCIICHLGGGASMCAIKNGKSIDTTMGFTPTEGLVMGTRSGDVDPGIITYLIKNKGMTIDQVSEMLNKQSGLVGLAGISDSRELCEASRTGNEAAVLARRVENYRIRKYIGAYIAAIGKIDAVVFTGGIGENNVGEREMILAGLEHIGIDLDKEKNRQTGGVEGRISSAISRIPVWVVPTNEELEIAKETLRVIQG